LEVKRVTLDKLNVLPGIGLGPARFGLTIREIEELFGRASGASFYDDGGERTIALDYRGVAFSFHQSDDFRLGNIEIDRKSAATLFGQRLFPGSRKGVIALLRKSLPEEDLSTVEERRDEELGEATLDVHSLFLTFYFDLSGALRHVGWSIVVGSDDQLKWPPLSSA
jgi:hypothetical protein